MLNKKHLFECLGLIYGDGSLKRGVSFANSCPKLISHTLTFFKDLNVDNKKIRCIFRFIKKKMN